VLNLRMPDNNRNRRLAPSEVFDPIVLLKHPNTLGDSFVNGIGGHLDGMLAAAKIGPRNDKSAKSHNRGAYHLVFSSPRNHARSAKHTSKDRPVLLRLRLNAGQFGKCSTAW